MFLENFYEQKSVFLGLLLYYIYYIVIKLTSLTTYITTFIFDLEESIKDNRRTSTQNIMCIENIYFQIFFFFHK